MYTYYKGETLRDWCNRNGECLPMMLYYYIMRDAGLLNREAEMADQDWNRRTDAFMG